MKILITGATGFIGTELTHKLSDDHQLVLVTRQPEMAQIKFSHLANIEIVTDLDAFSDFNEIDAVINLAGEPIIDKRWSEQQKNEICHSRWDITENLTKLINQSDQPPTVFISGSAIGFYGAQDDTYLTETATPNEDFAHDLCSKWEQLALGAQENTRVCLLRIGIVLGKSGGALEKMLLPYKLGLGGSIGDGKQGMSWIHIADLLGMIEFLLTNEETQGAYNATAPNPVSNKAFSQTLAHILHRPAIIPAPDFALKLALGERATLLTEGQFVIPQHALEQGFIFYFANLDDALEDLLHGKS